MRSDIRSCNMLRKEALKQAPVCAAVGDDSSAAWMEMLYYPYPESPKREPFLKSETVLVSSSLTRSQVLEFLNGACPSPAVLPPPKRTSQGRPPPQTVMHPNLVCTLKSILSPMGTDDTASQSSTSGYMSSWPSHSGVSKVGEWVAEGAANASSPETSKAWPRSRNTNQPEAVLVPLALIHNRRPYQCPFQACQRTFKNPQTMRMHHKTHFSDASSAAASAAKREPLFAFAAAAAPNKAGHNKKIPARCPTCCKTFVGLYELRRHFGRKHSEGEKRHACRKCAKRFHVEVDVRDHEKLCGEPIVCSGCGMKFAFKCNLVAHKRSRHPVCQVDMEDNKRAFQFKHN